MQQPNTIIGDELKFNHVIHKDWYMSRTIKNMQDQSSKAASARDADWPENDQRVCLRTFSVALSLVIQISSILERMASRCQLAIRSKLAAYHEWRAARFGTIKSSDECCSSQPSDKRASSKVGIDHN